MIKNYAEQIVEDIYFELLDKHNDICKCDKCITNIKCITLNNLKPLYYDSELGGVYLKLKSLHLQYQTDVIREITKAIKTVSQHTRH